MRRRILVIPDKFKGTLSAERAARAIAQGWRRKRPHDQLSLLPISDGGDGFGEVLGRRLRARIQSTATVNAAHRRHVARWWWEPRTKTAVIESAQIVGLARLPHRRFHPFHLDTFGLGAVLGAAAARGARRCFIGIGGTATNDGGFGLARALGWKFFDAAGQPIREWTGLERLATIHAPRRRRRFKKFIVAMDVRNPLLGPRGATRVYGPQKGLRPGDLARAERCLRRLASVVKKQLGKDFTSTPGAGAAGGLGFALVAFCGAQAEPGFDLIARQARLNDRLGAVDLVITGEGRIDASTFMGKATGEIARRCRKRKIPCIVLAGTVEPASRKRRLFAQVHALTDLTTTRHAQANAERWLARLSENIAASQTSVRRESLEP